MYSSALWNKNALAGILTIQSKRFWNPRLKHMQMVRLLVATIHMLRLQFLLQNWNIRKGSIHSLRTTAIIIYIKNISGAVYKQGAVDILHCLHI